MQRLFLRSRLLCTRIMLVAVAQWRCATSIRVCTVSSAAIAQGSLDPSEAVVDVYDSTSASSLQLPRTLLRAAGIALAWYKQQEQHAVKKWITENVECEDVRNIYLEYTVLESQISPIYVPAYIFRSTHLGGYLLF